MSTKSKVTKPPRIMVFRPTWKEFSNFSKYIEYMESRGAHLAGVAKVNDNKQFVSTQCIDWIHWNRLYHHQNMCQENRVTKLMN